MRSGITGRSSLHGTFEREQTFLNHSHVARIALHLHGSFVVLVLCLDGDNSPRRWRQRGRVSLARHRLILLHQLLARVQDHVQELGLRDLNIFSWKPPMADSDNCKADFQPKDSQGPGVKCNTDFVLSGGVHVASLQDTLHLLIRRCASEMTIDGRWVMSGYSSTAGIEAMHIQKCSMMDIEAAS